MKFIFLYLCRIFPKETEPVLDGFGAPMRLLKGKKIKYFFFGSVRGRHKKFFYVPIWFFGSIISELYVLIT
jgi:hypothetical protein